jgi:hypothetical protein
MKQSIWSAKAKKLAVKELLIEVNNYEGFRAKSGKFKTLRNVRFYENGMAKYIGKAHDYSVWLEDILKQIRKK